jgi:hypothetical protein
MTYSSKFFMLSYDWINFVLIVLKLGDWLIIVLPSADWLIDYCIMFRSIEDVTIIGERLQNLGLCSASRAIEQGGIFVVPHLLWHGPPFFRSHLKGSPIQSLLRTQKGMWRIYSNPDPPVVKWVQNSEANNASERHRHQPQPQTFVMKRIRGALR